MKTKHSVSKNDKYRALATEFLPYETPLIFSGVNFFFAQKGLKHDSLTKTLLNSKETSIPFSYKAHVNDRKERDLHLIHPSIQLSFCDFYENYHTHIVDRCSLSPVSLRKPRTQASEFYDISFHKKLSALDEETKDSNSDGFEKDINLFCSYFNYERFDKLYKFYESDEFIKLEKDFSRLFEFDIKKCFYNIYSHSIEWAIKNKSYAKSTLNSKVKMESIFDLLMQECNYRETNGIVVGPEISRIFAEIILQDVDQTSIQILEQEGIVLGRDYEVRRYIDNFFLFSNSESLENRISEVFFEVLRHYKLFINDAKSISYSRPFLSNQGIAVSEIKELIDVFSQDIFDVFNVGAWGQESYMPKAARRRALKWQSIANKYKIILKKNQLASGENSGLLFGGILKRIELFLGSPVSNTSLEDEIVAFERLIDDIFELSIFILKTGFSLQVLNLSLRAILLLRAYCSTISKSLAERINTWAQMAFRDLFVRTNVISGEESLSSNGKKMPLELLSFLVILRVMNNDSNLSNGLLRECWEISLEQGHLSDNKYPYWAAICILYYTQGKQEFSFLKRRILASFLTKIKESQFPKNSDLFYAYLDFSAYPDFSKSEKEKIWEAAFKITHGKLSGTNRAQQKLIYSSRTEPWFVKWDLEIDLLQELKKKELHRGY